MLSFLLNPKEKENTADGKKLGRRQFQRRGMRAVVKCGGPPSVTSARAIFCASHLPYAGRLVRLQARFPTSTFYFEIRLFPAPPLAWLGGGGARDKIFDNIVYFSYF